MANVRTNQILSTSPLPISSGGFPGLRYSRKRVLCYPTVISKHRKHLSAILAWLKLQQSLEIDFHYLHLLPTLNSMECKVLNHYHFICASVYLWAGECICAVSSVHIYVCVEASGQPGTPLLRSHPHCFLRRSLAGLHLIG